LRDHSKVGPEDKLQRCEKIGGNAGYVYADDADFAKRVQGNAALMKRLKGCAQRVYSIRSRDGQLLLCRNGSLSTVAAG